MNAALKDAFERFQVALMDRLARWSAGSSPQERARAAGLLSDLVFTFLPVRVEYVTATMRERLALDDAAAQTLCRRTYRTFFKNALEMASLPYLSREEVLARFEGRGLEHLREALARGRGAIIVSMHYGLWELQASWLVLSGFPLNVVVRRQNNKHMDRWLDFMRTRHGAVMTDSGFGLREILRTLRKGQSLGLMSDQDAGTKGIFVPFLGKLASTVVGPAEISRKTGAPIVLVGGHPRPRPPHIIEVSPPIFPEQFPDGPEGAIAITKAYTELLEARLREHPEQWFWLHRRWKTRPAAENQEPNPIGAGEKSLGKSLT